MPLSCPGRHAVPQPGARLPPTALDGEPFAERRTDDDDILLFTDDARTTDFARLHTLRQQMAKRDGRPNLALADYTAPVDSAARDFVGAFAVTAGIGLDEARKKFESAGDDYSAILLASLADRSSAGLISQNT